MMSQSSVTVALQHGWVIPEETQKENNICHLAAIKLQSLPTVSPEEIPELQTQDIGPR